jgi:NADP-dependent aldehyde dehydrogenase
VAVFCASNFPLAFSVAGGDTASALAAGCPVIVSAHSAHPGTAEQVAACLVEAARDTNMPEGTFSMLQGPGRTVGARLVAHPVIKAVGFTGSRAGGHALMKIATEREQPIPVYAEMSSVNPVVILPGALQDAGRPALANGLAASLTLGVGQFCTNPGLVLLPSGADGEAFARDLVAALKQQQPGVMLTRNIADAYQRALDEKANCTGVITVHRADPGKESCGGSAVFKVDAATFKQESDLQSEAFGPATLLVTYQNQNELIEALATLEGQLTGTIHAADSDLPLPPSLVEVLRSKVGRLIVNQFPTGVEVCHAMVHGGPYPATSDGRSTSVGTLAIERFCRPVCYQNFPVNELPPALTDANPLNIWRLVNGTVQRGPI